MADDTTPTKIALSSTGDVVLVLQDQTELTVSAGFLTHVSTTFSALLGGRFAEGQQPRSAQDPTRISLPDDDPQSMIDLCSLLHFRPLTDFSIICPTALDASFVCRFLGLATVADKYDSVTVLQLSVCALLAPLMRPDGTSQLDLAQLSDLVLGTYLLKLPRHYTVFSSRLVRDHTDPYTTLRTGRLVDRVGIAIIFSLESQRTAARNECIELVEGLTSLTCHRSHCGNKQDVTNFYEKIASKLLVADGKTGFGAVQSLS
nr:hypothetical protein B0A51_06773 [Rachicladosporium sp. CCFEE 5018]